MGTTTQDNSLRAMKARQTRKIEQLREIFLTNDRLRVREQAKLLGLCPSTAHAVLQRNYKSSGLSAAIIKRMLACPNLPERARTIILEYCDEKIAGLYGHTRSQRRRFVAAFATEQNLESQYRFGSDRAYIKKHIDGNAASSSDLNKVQKPIVMPRLISARSETA